MEKKRIIIFISALAIVSGLMLFGDSKMLPFLVPVVFAHCDTMDGPVIKDAKKALDARNVNLVLMWVQKKDEAELKKAFEKTLTVRKLSPQAKELADMYFFETLVRVHRAGEGAPYDGIKPARTEVEPGIEAADKAVDTGSVDPLIKDISENIANSIRDKFNEVIEKKKHAGESVDAGREYVEAYVTFIHYIEKLHMDISGPAMHHGMEKETKQEMHHMH